MRHPLASLALFLASAPAFAAITSVSGGAVHDTTTDLSTIDFDVDVYDSPDVVGFDEAQDVFVEAETVCVDRLVDAEDVGGEFAGAPYYGRNPCVYLEAGWYSSQILHYDGPGYVAASGEVFEFDGDVVGFAYWYTGLWSTDEAFGTASSYPNPYDRWVDMRDSWSLSAANEVTVDHWQHSPAYYDELRVITRAADTDGDGAPDVVDECPGTAPAQAVLTDGCSVYQTCPSSADWRIHPDYVRCVSSAADELCRDGSITRIERDMLVRRAVRSDVGTDAP